MAKRTKYFEDTALYRSHMAAGKAPYPEVIQFEVTSRCNLRCIMCPITSRHRERTADDEFFSLEQVRQLDELWEHATEIEMTGFGEIFTHPDLLPILRHLRTKRLSLYGSSNGTLMTPEISEVIVAEGLLDVLCFSIDAASGPTYRRIRRGGRWSVLNQNLQALADAKKAHSTSAPILFFSFCAMKKNITELPDFIRMAAGYGAAKVIVQHVVESKLTPGESLVHHREMAEPIMEDARKTAKELGIELDMRNLDPVEQGDARAVDDGIIPTPAAFKEANQLVKDCPFPWEHIFLKSNYEVQPCAILWEEMVMGNLREASIDEIWNGKKYRKMRANMCGTDAPDECVYCLFKGWRKPTPTQQVKTSIAMDHMHAGQLGCGWHGAEQSPDGRWFRWAKQEANFFLRNNGSSILEVEAYEHADGPFLRGEVLVNKEPVANITSHDLWGRPLRLALPPQDAEFLEITFRFRETWQPGSQSGTEGQRRLTAFFYGAKFTGDPKTIPSKINFTETSPSLGRGWYSPEELLGKTATWSQTNAQIILPNGNASALDLEIALPEGDPQTIHLKTGKAEIGSLKIPGDGAYHKYQVPLPASNDPYRILNLQFESQQTGGTGDRETRPLGAIFRSIRISEKSFLGKLLGF